MPTAIHATYRAASVVPLFAVQRFERHLRRLVRPVPEDQGDLES
jgi:hypothetical protein